MTCLHLAAAVDAQDHKAPWDADLGIGTTERSLMMEVCSTLFERVGLELATNQHA